MTHRHMMAAVVREAGLLTIEQVPVPEISDYTVLCRNICGATCTATDQHIIDQSLRMKLPTMLGHETIGRVVDAGSKVRHFKMGQRITRTEVPSMEGLNSSWGGYAEYGLALDWQAMKEDGLEDYKWMYNLKNQVIPDDIPDEVAPMLITWRETHSFITRLGVQPGMRVLIIGTGGNGLSFSEHAKWEGASAVVVGSAGRETHARMCGADEFISYRDPECAGKLSELAGSGFDILIDAVGSEKQTLMALPFLKKGGMVGIYGINERVKLPEGDYRLHDGKYCEGETHDRVIEGVRAGAYRADVFYDMANPYPLARLADAFAMLARKEWPKALITF